MPFHYEVDFLYSLFTFGEGGRGRERGKHPCETMPLALPLPEIKPATQACVLNQQPFGAQNDTQSIKPHQPELK